MSDTAINDRRIHTKPTARSLILTSIAQKSKYWMKSECLDSGIRQKEQWFDNDVSSLSRHALP